MIQPRRPVVNRRQKGFSLIEVLMAMALLLIMSLGLIPMFATAIKSNGRSKFDSTATMIAQAVLEQVTACKSGGGPDRVTDGLGTVHIIGYNIDATGSAGAKLTGTGLPGIDFTESAPPVNYQMDYVVARNDKDASPAIYDVRWNVRLLGTSTYVVTVGARLKGTGQFSLPVTLRAYVGEK